MKIKYNLDDEYFISKIEYEYNPNGTNELELSVSTNIKTMVPSDDHIDKPIIIIIRTEVLSSENELKFIIQVKFKLMHNSDEILSSDELYQDVRNNGIPLAYNKMSEIIKTLTTYAKINSINLPDFKDIKPDE